MIVIYSCMTTADLGVIILFISFNRANNVAHVFPFALCFELNTDFYEWYYRCLSFRKTKRGHSKWKTWLYQHEILKIF